MRRGIADLHRRAEVSQKALDRYCEALASVDDSATLEELTARIERRTKWNGTSVRALHPFDPGDCALLEAVNRGEFTIHGLRNRDLQRLLYSTPATDKQQTRKRSAAISRKLRLLRARADSETSPHASLSGHRKRTFDPQCHPLGASRHPQTVDCQGGLRKLFARGKQSRG